MDKRKQRIASIIIGLILAGLLVVIAVRVIQERASRASAPTSFSATRIDVDSCRITMTTMTDDPGLLQYGSPGNLTFYHRFDESQVTPNSDGTFTQEADVNDLSEDSVEFMVVGHEDARAICAPYTGSTGGQDTSAGKTGIDALDSQDAVAQPTEPPSVPDEPITDTDTDLDDPDGDEDYTPLTIELAREFFQQNEGSDATECWDEFKANYTSYVHPCAQAWKEQ